MAEAKGGGKPAPRKRKERGNLSRGYGRSEAKNQAVRDSLTPLAEGERPTVVTLGAIASILVSASVILGYVLGVKVDGHRPEIVQVLSPAFIFGVMAWGMWMARYWAVLGFQIILLLILFSAFFGLTTNASTVGEFIGTGSILVGAGLFFFFMVKAMARIQMPTREPRD